MAMASTLIYRCTTPNFNFSIGEKEGKSITTRARSLLESSAYK